MMALSEEQRKQAEALIANTDPEFIKKYGNPLDENDPRHWQPTTRGERGISVSDRVRLLELDMEIVQTSLGNLIRWVASEEERQVLEQLKTDPRAAVERLSKMIGEPIPDDIKKMLDGRSGPNGENGPLFAGSVAGAPGDALVVTPQGTIHVNQIPGYKNDPDWRPSTDWVEMNCMCEQHVNAREHNAVDDRFDFLRDDGRGGMYP
jgi:hypothetical protein